MKILLAPDSFKNSMTSKEVVDIFGSVLLNHVLVKKPLADGGEGSLSVLQNQFKLKKIPFQSLDSYQNQIKSYYLLDEDNKIAYIESALICGIQNIDKKNLNIMESSSIGIGIAIEHAIAQGVKEVYLFLGGTATNDGGLGILKGLDYQLLDKNKQNLEGKTKDLGQLVNLVPPKKTHKLSQIHLISDVTNPLLGKEGATYVYGEQKGASKLQINAIEQSMKQYHQVISQYFNRNLAYQKSTGAAGGIPYLLANLFPYTIKSGIEFFIKELDIESIIEEVDLVITGEGKIDEQSFHGKTISQIINLCKKYGKDYVLVCGINDLTLKELSNDKYFKGILEIRKEAKDLEESIEEGSNILRKMLLNTELEYLINSEK